MLFDGKNLTELVANQSIKVGFDSIEVDLWRRRARYKRSISYPLCRSEIFSLKRTRRVVGSSEGSGLRDCAVHGHIPKVHTLDIDSRLMNTVLVSLLLLSRSSLTLIK